MEVLMSFTTEILDNIYAYISDEVKMYLSKKNYINLRSNKKVSNISENFIRNVVRKDYSFLFQYLLNDNYNRWFKMKNYLYHNCIYANYIIFLENYCIEYRSNRCLNVIINLFDTLGLKKKKHKKNNIKYLRWK